MSGEIRSGMGKENWGSQLLSAEEIAADVEGSSRAATPKRRRTKKQTKAAAAVIPPKPTHKPTIPAAPLSKPAKPKPPTDKPNQIPAQPDLSVPANAAPPLAASKPAEKPKAPSRVVNTATSLDIKAIGDQLFALNLSQHVIEVTDDVEPAAEQPDAEPTGAKRFLARLTKSAPTQQPTPTKKPEDAAAAADADEQPEDEEEETTTAARRGAPALTKRKKRPSASMVARRWWIVREVTAGAIGFRIGITDAVTAPMTTASMQPVQAINLLLTILVAPLVWMLVKHMKGTGLALRAVLLILVPCTIGYYYGHFLDFFSAGTGRDLRAELLAVPRLGFYIAEAMGVAASAAGLYLCYLTRNWWRPPYKPLFMFAPAWIFTHIPAYSAVFALLKFSTNQ
ncbi:hypothetical protein [Streptomyces noursei]